jgi:Spy/CpxP family protein refolding chaperone
MLRVLMLAVGLLLSLNFAEAQQPSPYRGFETRTIKALSDDEIADLRAGRGMRLALAAELNGYPGPAHVLEWAEQLNLTPTQRTRVQQLFDRMKAEAIPLGEEYVRLESDLDRQFAAQAATEDSVASTTTALGRTQGSLRNVHLKFHLHVLQVLTPEQTRKYSELRGYSSSTGRTEDDPHVGPRNQLAIVGGTQ